MTGTILNVEGEHVIVENVETVNVAWSTTTWDFVAWPADLADDPLRQQAVDMLVIDMVRRHGRQACPWCGQWHSADDELCPRIPGVHRCR